MYIIAKHQMKPRSLSFAKTLSLKQLRGVSDCARTILAQRDQPRSQTRRVALPVHFKALPLHRIPSLARENGVGSIGSMMFHVRFKASDAQLVTWRAVTARCRPLTAQELKSRSQHSKESRMNTGQELQLHANQQQERQKQGHWPRRMLQLLYTW